MAGTIRFADVVRASTPRRLPDARATQRREAGYGTRRRAQHPSQARGDAVACRIAWPAAAAADAPASGGQS